MKLHYLFVVVVVSDINIMSSTVAVIFAITWVVNNRTERRFLDWTEPNSFQTKSKLFFSKNRTETNPK